MNTLMIAQVVRLCWKYIRLSFYLLIKYWYICFIVLLLVINTQLRGDNLLLNQNIIKLQNESSLAIQKQKTDLLEAQKKAQEKEIEILTKQKEVEVKYNEQIKALSNDVAIARNSANSLSKQLADNTVKLSTASKAEINTYNESLSIVLEDSTRKYLDMAGEADAKRLAEERCVGLYNSLVDDNKE